MSPEDAEAQRKSALAQMLKKARENWPYELELIAFQAQMAWARYQALKKVGFTQSEALQICTKTLEL